jgi:hypothetical protein
LYIFLDTHDVVSASINNPIEAFLIIFICGVYYLRYSYSF